MAPALDSALVRKLRGMERRFAILSHYGPGTGSGLSIEFRPDRDQNSIDLPRRRLLVGLRPFIGDSQMEAVVPVAVEMAMDQTRWQTLPFDPEAFGCPEPLFLLLEQRKTLLRMESDKSFRTSQRLLLYARLKSRRLEESDSFRKGKTFILDPYHLGQRVLLSLSGSPVFFPDKRYPARFFLLKPFYGFSRPGSYRKFLLAWGDLFRASDPAERFEETARRGALFREQWHTVFDRHLRPTGSLAQSLGDHPETLPGNPAPRNFQVSPGDSRKSSGNPSSRPVRKEGDAGKKTGGEGLGLEVEDPAEQRGADIPSFEPSPEAVAVFEWNERMIRQEVDSLLRFLKIGLPQEIEDGLVGRLIARKLSEPTFKVMRRPLDPRRPRDLRLLVIMDCSLSMTGDPHYYGAHLIRLIESARIARVLDVVACSTRYAFRLAPVHLNYLFPDETDGFYTLVPFLESIRGHYDLAVVLTDCQNSDRSLNALEKLRRTIPTVGCYVLPENLGEMAHVPFEQIVEDGRRVFPRAFIHSRSFHGLGRRLALYLNMVRGRGRGC